MTCERVLEEAGYSDTVDPLNTGWANELARNKPPEFLLQSMIGQLQDALEAASVDNACGTILTSVRRVAQLCRMFGPVLFAPGQL